MLRHRSRGSATTEVALILTLLSCGMLITYARLGTQSQQTFRRLSLEGLADNSLNVSADGDSRGQSKTNMSDATASNNRDDDTPVVAIFLSFSAALGFLSIGLLVALRSRKRILTAPPEPLPEPATKISELPEALFSKRQGLLHLFEQIQPHLSETPATVDLVMSPRLTKAEPDAKSEDLRQVMQEERLRHLLICDRQGKLLGVISDRDLAKPGKTAEEIMTPSPVTVNPKTPLITAVTMLVNRRFSSLPVVEDGIPVGILTTTDILLAMQALVMLMQNKK